MLKPNEIGTVPKTPSKTHQPNHNSNHSRSRSASRMKHLHNYEVQERKLIESMANDDSPYACKVIELPPDMITGKTRKLVVCDRDNKTIGDEIKNRKSIGLKERHTVRSLTGDSVVAQLFLAASSQLTVTGPMPLKSWPFSSRLSQLAGTQTNKEKVRFSEKSDAEDSQIDSLINSCLVPPPNSVIDEVQTEVDTSKFLSLEKLADKIEQGIFCASEACTVILHTIFKESLGNPNALEAILESEDFQNFLHAPNEAQALRGLATLLRAASHTVDEYLDTLEDLGVTFPSRTDFATKSSQTLVRSTSSKSTNAAIKVKKAEFKANVWSFTPPETAEKFQLSLFRDPNTGDVVQTISCQNSIYRARYSTSPLQKGKICNIITATTEHFGLPEIAETERLLDTFIRCSSFASTRLIHAKASISKCCKNMYKIGVNFSRSKYSLENAGSLSELDKLNERLQEINTFAGIVYQMSIELAEACEKMQIGIRKTMALQENLKFPRIPGYPNPRLNKECQLPAGTEIPVHNAMIQLSEGTKGVIHTLRTGQYSLDTEKNGKVPLKREHRIFIKDYIEGVQALGTIKDIDLGSLLMTLLCSAELIKHFEEDLIDSIDAFHRAYIVNNLGKINWSMLEISSSVKRLKNDSYVLTLQTFERLKGIKKKKIEGALKDTSFLGLFW